MIDYLDKISFSPYNSTTSVMRIDNDRYFIISNEKRRVLGEILSGDDEDLKKAVYERITNFTKDSKEFLSVQDFQYKKVLIGRDTIGLFTKYLTFLYNKYIFCGVIITISVLFSYFYIFNVPQNLSTVMSFDYSWLLIMFIFFYNELGHATACTKFGVKSCSIGFGITLLMPVLYADVSSSWSLEKKQRMVVNFGGIYFQNIFACIFMLIAIYLGNNNLFFLSKTIALSTIFQLFPFYKSDGYWILTDLYGEPKLFKKSQKMFYRMLRHGILPKSKQNVKIVLYYFFVEGFILYFLAKTITHYGEYILSLPSFFLNIVRDILGNRFDLMTFEWKYLVAIVIFFFMIRIHLNNIKLFISSDISE